MSELSFVGGISIGWVHASWPLAKLTVFPSLLVLSGIGRYEFSPSQVVSIEPYGSMPFVNWGIRINHNRTDVPKNIVFRCLGSRQRIIKAITQSGFLPTGKPVVRPTGFPVKWSIAIATVVLWNFLFYLDGAFDTTEHHLPGAAALIGLVGMFVGTSAAKFFPTVQRFILRDGHNFGEVREFFSLTQLLTGVLSVGFGLTYWLNR